MLRQSLLLGAATMVFVGAGQSQTRGQSRNDLLDALTRHIQICSEITDSQQKLTCYERLQTQVGGVTPPRQQQQQPQQQPQQPPQRTPTPLQASPAAPPPAPQPLELPGGGVATLGGQPPAGAAPPAYRDPDAAFDPRSATYRPPEAMGPKPQPQMRRTGPRPVPNFATPQPLVTLGAANLTYGASRYWQVTVTLTSNTQRAISTQAECTFMNGGRPVSTDYLGPVMIQPGEQITTELIGPPTTTYVDSSNCKVVSP